VISIDAVVLQTSGIKLSDRAGLTAELTIRVAERLLPFSAFNFVSFSFNLSLYLRPWNFVYF